MPPGDDVARPSTAARPARLPIARVAPGLLLAVTIALASAFVMEHHGGPAMLYALLLGIAFHFLGQETKCAAGITFASKSVLRLGVALLGARITVGDVAALGVPTVLLVVGGVAFTVCAGWAVGRLFRLTSDHAVLSAGAVAICGASAALAIASVLPNHRRSERNTILTVVGVTTLSTAAMVLYPTIVHMLGFDHRQAGVFLGATIHDVAQVVGAGYMISDQAGETAAIVKLMRVGCLLPAVVAISLAFRAHRTPGEGGGRPPLLPPFLIGFVVLMLANSAGLLPAAAVEAIGQASRWCLLVAVAALGVKTSLRDILSVGPGPIAAVVVQTLMLALFVLGGLHLLGGA